jgi:uncharacterized Zn-binding protein involved in type VI secretion
MAQPGHFGVLFKRDSGEPPNVNIGSLPAVRMSDHFQCSLHPWNLIVNGSATVWINHHPAARVGDALACGATIGTGCATVHIGGPTHGAEGVGLGPIQIRGSPAFIRRVLVELLRLMLLPDGRRLLFSLKDVTIVEYTGLNSYTIPLKYPGAAVIGYNPNLTVGVYALGTPTGMAPTPSHLVLGHELIHASHDNNGTHAGAAEETHTIGTPYVPPPEGEATENSLRQQQDPALGQRVGHAGIPGIAPGVPPGPVR